MTQIVTGTTGDKEFHAKWTENLPSGGDDKPSGGGDKTPDSASGGSAKAPSSASKPAGVPKTGDDGMVALWLALAAVSALGLGYATARKRKN